jgi:RNA polymerase sigma-70 factor (sigma-E family)
MDRVAVTETVGDAGDLDAFERFYRDEHARLVGLALTFVHDRDGARDLVQEAFIRTYRHWPEVRDLDRPGAWTRRVLVNLCIDATRRRQRESVATRRAGAEPVAEAVPQGLDPATSAFWSVAAELPDLQRSVLALYYVDDLSVAEIATVLQVHSGTVKTSLFRARRRLARLLEDPS